MATINPQDAADRAQAAAEVARQAAEAAQQYADAAAAMLAATAHAATGKWNVNCVAAWDHYTLAVMLRYPIARKLDYGAGVCRDVTTTLLARLD